ncbi:signal recognition particle subunit SRP14 [Acrasis kona]|uniref:Signal recognition particle 14 kDa protein n=1 Tax=Acrasis kona TaxID=1008807 RepID=A0AAW2Z305_9EUKA
MVFIERPDDFVAEISKLYEKNKGSVWVTLKKYPHKNLDTPVEPQQDENKKKYYKGVPKESNNESSDKKNKKQQPKKKKNAKLGKEGCLVRAVAGDTKISTIIITKEVARFQGFLFNIFSQNFKLKQEAQEKKVDVTNTQKTTPAVTAASTSHAKEVAQKKKKKDI